MTNGIKEQVRFQYLDALRGIAAVSVCFHHLFNYISSQKMMSPAANEFIKTSILESFDFGRFGVVLFFLISGFIIPNSLKPNSTLKKFTITRIFRLYPAFWVTCFLIFLATPYISDQKFSLYQLFANLTMLPKLFHSPEMSGVFWTLFVEILFYFLCAALFQVRVLEKPLFIGAIALTLHAVTPMTVLLNNWLHVSNPVRFLPYHLSFLFIGSLFRLAMVNKNRQAQIIAPVLILCTLMSVPITTGLLLDSPQALESDFVMHNPAATTYSYFLAIATFLVVTIKKFNFNKLMVDMGKVSYSLYLLHMLCFIVIAKIINPTTLAGGVLYIVVSAVVSFIVAKASFKFIEEPAIQLGRNPIWSGRTGNA